MLCIYLCVGLVVGRFVAEPGLIASEGGFFEIIDDSVDGVEGIDSIEDVGRLGKLGELGRLDMVEFETGVSGVSEVSSVGVGNFLFTFCWAMAMDLLHP